MKIIFKIVVLALLFLPIKARAEFLGLNEFYLKNGLRVLLIENHKAPVAAQVVFYKSGAVDEPAFKGGVAHLLEHLMFRGTSKVPDSAFNDIMAQNGAENNAFTSQDMTAYHELTDISRLELSMALEADRMQNLNFTDDAFEKERQIVFQERKQRISNNPTARFAEDFNRLFWQNQPYARPVTGTEDEILNLTPDDARNFYRAHYRPENAILVLSGDLDLKTAKKLAEKYYGAVPKAAQTLPSSFKMPPLLKASYRMQQHQDEITSPRIIIQYRVPSLSEDAEAAYALSVLESYLGEGDNAYLNRALVQSGKLLGIDVSYRMFARLGGSLTVTALPLKDADLNKTEAQLKKTLEEAFEEITPEILEKQKTKMLAGLVYSRDNPLDAAMLAGSMAVHGLSADEIESYAQNIEAVDMKAIEKAIQIIKKSPTVAVGLLLPGEEQ